MNVDHKQIRRLAENAAVLDVDSIGDNEVLPFDLYDYVCLGSEIDVIYDVNITAEEMEEAGTCEKIAELVQRKINESKPS